MTSSPMLAIVILAVSSTCFSAGHEVSAIRSMGSQSELIAFDAALNQALLNSPKIRGSEAAVGIADQDLIRARSPFLPRLDVSSSTLRLEAFGTIPGLESLLLSGRNSIYHSASSVSLGLNIFNGGADLANLRLANEKLLEARLQLQLQRLSVASVVVEHFHSARQAELELRIAELQVGLSANQVSQAEMDLSVGRISALAFSEAQYEHQLKELAKVTKERLFKNAQRDLMMVTGTDPDLLAITRGSSIPPEYSDALSLRGFDVAGVVSEIDVSKSRLRQAQVEVKHAKGRYFPKVDFVARTDYAAINEAGFGSAFKDQQKDKTFRGFNLTWNLFDGFDTSAEVSAASLRIARAQADHDVAVEELRKKTAELTRPLMDAEDEILIERKKFDLVQKKLEINREKLELGKLDLNAFRATEVELVVQKLELEKRVELISYYKGKLLLRQGRK